MVNVQFNADYEGKPLAVLSDLIRERQRVLGESAQDAVIATGINALMSLRALTKVAKKAIPKSDVRFAKEDPQYITATKGKNRGKLLRRVVVSRWFNGEKRNFIKWQVCDNVRTTKRGLVRPGRATPAERRTAWERWGQIRNRGLARRVWGMAMNRLSTRSVADKVTGRVSRLASANVSVRTIGSGMASGGSHFVLNVTDRLNYAIDALKGGRASVDLALKKAANKTAGILAKVAEKKFGEKISAPFPEVKGRKVS